MDAAASSPLGWLCAGVTTLVGVTMLCTAQRSPQDRAKVLLWSLLPALLGLLCVATLGAGGGLGVFVAGCLLCSVYLADRDLLPVGDRAVVITGKVLPGHRTKQKLPLLTSGLENFLSSGLVHACESSLYSSFSLCLFYLLRQRCFSQVNKCSEIK